MSDERPTPEQILARMKVDTLGSAEESPRGRLRIFFGYAAGVGKTYAMLKAARIQKNSGVDALVGYVEPHGRPETEALLEGLESLPLNQVQHKGTHLREFNLDAALLRKPSLILVDELAHTNAPGSRHVKRWQDVIELLDAGIDVYTTVNVQHVESLNDVVAQITGITVRETIPDELLDRATEVTLIDLPPAELLTRLQQGKVYIPAQAARAIENFFRKENLVALRELSLRKAADRVNADVQTAHFGTATLQPWLTSERLMVCVGPSPTSATVVRAAKRLADLLRAPWIAAHVETPQSLNMNEADRNRLINNLKLAEQLGAETVTLSGIDVVQETLTYAHTRNITKIVLGKTDRKSNHLFHRQSLVDRLLEYSGSVDVFLVRGSDESARIEHTPATIHQNLKGWGATTTALTVSTVICLIFDWIGLTEANLVMTYLLAVVYVGTRCGAVQSSIAAALSVLLFDVLFVPPYWSFSVHDSQYILTFCVMIFVGLLTSTLASRAQRQAELSRRNERRMEAVTRLSRQLADALHPKDLIPAVESAASEVLGGNCILFLPDVHGHIRPVLSDRASFGAIPTEAAAAQWVIEHDQKAGAGTDTLPNASASYFPLRTGNKTLGVLGIQHTNPQSLTIPEIRELVETTCSQIAVSIERSRLIEKTRQQSIQVETEKLRSSLLSSISHDLRTPLAAIAGASEGLLNSSKNSFSEETRNELLESIYDESHRLTRLVENILHMTRLSSGDVRIAREWHPLEDIIGSALNRMSKFLEGRRVETHLPPEELFAFVDPVLLEQVLLNLIENAVRYTPVPGRIILAASEQGDETLISVLDEGPGIPPGEEERIFERFQRGLTTRMDTRGTGLGLAICQAILKAHGGTISASNRAEGGAIFQLRLPKEGSPPPTFEDHPMQGE